MDLKSNRPLRTDPEIKRVEDTDLDTSLSGGYAVFVHNDDITLYNFVIDARPLLQTHRGRRTGYDIDFVLNSPDDKTWGELLAIAYTLLHEFYDNFVDERPMFLELHIGAYQNDVFTGCVLGAAIGHQAVSTYLPAQRPSNLEAWFSALRNVKYYGDLPGQSDALLAYGNDPAFTANCDIGSWQR